MTMTTAEAPEASRNDVYDPEDVGLRDSPPPRIYKPKLKPTPSPSPEDPDSEDSSPPGSPNKRKTKRPTKSVPSQGDAVLIGLLGGGKTPDVARTAATEILASGSDDEEMADESRKGVKIGADSGGDKPMDLEALAAGALKAHAANSAVAPASVSSAMIDDKATVLPNGYDRTDGTRKDSISGIKTEPSDEGLRHLSPTTSSTNNQDIRELAPIQEPSPKLEKVNNLTLPSISAQLGNIDDLKHLAEAATSTAEVSTNNVHRPSFSQSPPQPPLFQVRDSAVSSPISPNENFRRELPSPGRTAVSAASFYYSNNPRRPSQASEGPLYTLTPGDYSSSATETPSTDQSGATPAGIPVAIDRMSIDGITNPPAGGFQCTYPGCTAQPFQTQYLLNSHANVHSSNRPHYCPVKGCPRSEGGKGFKRKNEMIRHGLVHESPGYVCPYCVDREHKYPRPDNLQRHVRVHHVDKDKDDPQLREVLAQRPEGPSRGRRRRGGTN